MYRYVNDNTLETIPVRPLSRDNLIIGWFCRWMDKALLKIRVELHRLQSDNVCMCLHSDLTSKANVCTLLGHAAHSRWTHLAGHKETRVKVVT